MWLNLNAGSVIASVAATRTGMYSGRQPAITALMASSSALRTRSRSGISPSTWSGARPAASRKARTRFSVGGTTGRPSVQPRS